MLLLIGKNRTQSQSRLWLYQTNSDFDKPFLPQKPTPEMYLEPSRAFTIKVFCDFRKEALP